MSAADDGVGAGFVKAQRSVLRRKDISPTGKLVLFVLRDMHARFGVASPSWKLLAEYIGVTEGTARAAVRRLERAGFLRREAQKKASGIQTYNNLVLIDGTEGRGQESPPSPSSDVGEGSRIAPLIETRLADRDERTSPADFCFLTDEHRRSVADAMRIARYGAVCGPVPDAAIVGRVLKVMHDASEVEALCEFLRALNLRNAKSWALVAAVAERQFRHHIANSLAGQQPRVIVYESVSPEVRALAARVLAESDDCESNAIHAARAVLGESPVCVNDESGPTAEMPMNVAERTPAPNELTTDEINEIRANLKAAVERNPFRNFNGGKGRRHEREDVPGYLQ